MSSQYKQTPLRKKSSGSPSAMKKRKNGGKKLFPLLWISGGILIFALIIWIFPYIFTGSAIAAVIRIPKNADQNMVSDTLAKYFGNDYARRTFRIFNALESKPFLRYGAYEIPEGSSPAKAARILARGVQSPVRITINGVREFYPFADLIAKKFTFSGEDLIKEMNRPEICEKYGLTPEQMPALFFNDTYFLYWTATPAEVIEKIGENYSSFWNEERIKKADDLGLTPAEIMIVASIVDEETNKVEEKGRIGRLYINRLNKKMKLQADPTVKFALKDFSIRRITKDHLKASGPYNTYRVEGLPPGPIRTTSKETVNEILNSSPSDDIYMCAKEDFSGYHNFASNYEEHLQNASRYQKALDNRGIK